MIEKLTIAEWGCLPEAKASGKMVEYGRGKFCMWMCKQCRYALCHVCGEAHAQAALRNDREKRRRKRKEVVGGSDTMKCGHNKEHFKLEYDNRYLAREREKEGESTEGYDPICKTCGDGL